MHFDELLSGYIKLPEGTQLSYLYLGAKHIVGRLSRWKRKTGDLL